jgi:Stress responsive A/B Barrel Domain
VPARPGRPREELGLSGGPDFDSTDDQTIYRDHPVHQRVITDLIAPIRADRAAVHFEAG